MATYKIILRGKAVNILYQNITQQPIPVGVSVEAKFFRQPEKKKPVPDGKWIKNTAPDADEYNTLISERLSELKTYVNRYFLDNKCYPLPKDLKGFFSVAKYSGKTFEQIFNQFIYYQTHKGNESVSDGRVKHYKTVRDRILQYKPAININQIDVSFYDGFKHFLKTTHSNGENRISSVISILKAFLNWAIEKEKTTVLEKTVRKFKVKWKERDIIFNPANELQMLLDVELEEFSYNDKMRDSYLLQCFIGVRHSDLKPDKWQIENNQLRKITDKTEEEFTIPLRSEARHLIEKYTMRGVPFPEYENQPYNRAIKDIARLAGITQNVTMVKGRKKFKPGETIEKCLLLSSHTARATFICMMIEQNVQSWKIMRMTGIKKESTLKHYAAVLDKSLQPDMDAVESKQALRITHIRKAV